jgi:CubicO group peptidase (beta-lactamase class C family)
MTDTQYQVQHAIDRPVESGAEQGLQVAVYRHGEPVVDAVAGVADPTTGRQVTSDTLFFSYSIGKGVASTVVHVLAERGILDYDTRIAELWPEFGAHGKEGATVRHALSQSVGVGGSHAYADTRTGTTFALTKNRLAPNFDTAEKVAEIVTKAVADS